jgi:hypothetical protein
METLITLPSREVMIEVLIAVNKEPHFQERLYPLIARHAGEQIYVSGLKLMCTLCVYDYAIDLPHPIINQVMMLVPEFIKALEAASTPTI